MKQDIVEGKEFFPHPLRHNYRMFPIIRIPGIRFSAYTGPIIEELYLQTPCNWQDHIRGARIFQQKRVLISSASSIFFRSAAPDTSSWLRFPTSQ